MEAQSFRLRRFPDGGRVRSPDISIEQARSDLKSSAVADNLSGEITLSEVRTSSGMFISKGKDPIISGIEDKIAAWTFLPKENGEDI